MLYTRHIKRLRTNKTDFNNEKASSLFERMPFALNGINQYRIPLDMEGS